MSGEQLQILIDALNGHLSMVLALIGVLFLAIIGVYIFLVKNNRDTTRELGKVYELCNGHLRKAEIHKPNAVGAEVCEQIQETNKIEFGFLKDGQKRIEIKVDKIVSMQSG